MWFIFPKIVWKPLERCLRGEEPEKPGTENQETYLERSI